MELDDILSFTGLTIAALLIIALIIMAATDLGNNNYPTLPKCSCRCKDAKVVTVEPTLENCSQILINAKAELRRVKLVDELMEE